MNPAWGHVVGVIIVVLMLVFIGIWIWAWRPRHKRNFDRMAELPMEDPLAGSAKPGAASAPQDEDKTP